jgi:DNA invertase Pin-like site-specific DNA recombinase
VQPAKAGANPETPRPVGCAIYTRKSTDEGLEQEFNSLDAQRECAEAYILSQRHEGWTALQHRYDDGGFTGANTDRPGLRHLLADVEAGGIDCVVVYKVDRLSRSLLDFARIMEVLDQRHVSFVSVTQQLNSSSPMGRLTLNVLLSFAQFEREIISERTRDKQSAARRKGKWIGGYPMLGYDPDPSQTRLVVNEAEAKQVRQIFRIYLRHGALIPALAEINRRGLRMKSWTTEKGRAHIGQSFDRPALVRLLANVLYVGEVKHKGKIYPGEQPAIVDRKTWAKVNNLLRSRSRGSDTLERNRQGAILRGILNCAVCGSRMVHGYATNHGRRYRYYVCLTAQKRGAVACPGQTVGAERIESAVVDGLYDLAGTGEPHWLREALPVNREDWDGLTSAERHSILWMKIERVSWTNRTGQARIRLRARAGRPKPEELMIWVRKKANVSSQKQQAQPVGASLPRITRLMALAIRFESLLRKGVVKDYSELARLGGVSRARITQIMNMRNLAPAIQERLLFLPAGESPVQERAMRRITEEKDWRRQLKMFGEFQTTTAYGNPRGGP